MVWMGTESQGLPKPPADSGDRSSPPPGSVRLFPRSRLPCRAPRRVPCRKMIPACCHSKPRGMVAPSQLRLGTEEQQRLVCLFSAWFGRQPGQAALGGAVCSPSTVGGAGPAPAAPSLFPLPRAPSPLASLRCLFLAASEPPCASSANARPAILCPFDSLTAAMTEGEDPAASRSTGPALCRSDQGILMPEPHPPDSCPGKRILLFNSLLGVFVSTPPLLSFLLLGTSRARTRDVQE